MANWVLKQGFPVLTVTEDADGPHHQAEPLPLHRRPHRRGGQDAVVRAAHAQDRRRRRQGRRRPRRLPQQRARGQDPARQRQGRHLQAQRRDHRRLPRRILARASRQARRGGAKKDSAFSLEDRLGLVSDAFTLASAGYGKTSGGLSLAKALAQRPHVPGQLGVVAHLGTLASAWWEQDAQVTGAIKKLRADIFGPHGQELGFEFGADDSPDLKQLRAVAIAAASAGEDAWTLGEIKKRLTTLPPRAMTARSTRICCAPPWRAPSSTVARRSTRLCLPSTASRRRLRTRLQPCWRWCVQGGQAAGAHRGLPVWRRGRAECGAVLQGQGHGQVLHGLSQGLDAVRARARWVERDAEDVKQWLQANGYLA
ncbi:hypothetical protein L1887_59057 [Cichorium endivia]|nr:hypothetical protein L1887_59057 [Cichorium endivia]